MACLWRSNVLSILDKKRAPTKPIGKDLKQDQTDCRFSNGLEFRPTMLARQRAQNIARASVAFGSDENKNRPSHPQIPRSMSGC